MMDKLSNPVAFASTPLHENDDPTPIIQHHSTEKYDAAINEEESSRIEREMSSISESFFMYKEEDQKNGTKAQKGDDDSR